MNRYPVAFVGAGPGDPELITLKGQRLLTKADCIVYAGSLVNPALLQGLAAEIHNSASLDLETIMALLIDNQRAGKRVVRLHTGDPSLYGAIHEQMQRLRAAGVPYEVVPGVSSALAAAAAIQAELTVPEVSQTVIFTRLAGRTPVPAKESLARLAGIQATMALFLSVARIETVVAELRAGGYPETTPVAVVSRATWPDERICRGTLADIATRVQAAGMTRTAMILVGAALDPQAQTRSRLYHASFGHGCRNGKG